MIKNSIIKISGTYWKIRRAVSFAAAKNEITMACVTGSIGGKSVVVNSDGTEEVLADVIQINSDGTERIPYSAPY